MPKPQPERKRQGANSVRIDHSKAEMIKNLAKSVLEVLKEASVKINDPFENYANFLKMRICKDAKQFSSRSIQGYKIILELIRSQKKE